MLIGACVLITLIKVSIFLYMGRDATKPAFGVSDKVRSKPVSSAIETCKKIVISLVLSLDMVLSNKQTKRH